MGFDYNTSYNKPKINGVEVLGDVSGSELGLQNENDENLATVDKNISGAINEVLTLLEPKEKVLFEGAVKTGNIILSESMFNYRYLVVHIASAITGEPYGEGIIPCIKYQNPTGGFPVVGFDNPFEHQHSTYMGMFKKIDSMTLNIVRQITNVIHTSKENHDGGTSYFVRTITGVR